MNDTAFHELYQAFARRLMDTPEGERLERAFELTVARAPRLKEAEVIAELLAHEKDALQTKPKEAKQLAPNAKGDAVELAAWTAVARVLMNTDEFITRE